MTINIILLAAITLLLSGGFLLAPRTADGRIEIVNSLSVFIVAVAFNLLLPAWLVLLFKEGALTWARQLSAPEYVRLGLLHTALGIGAFLLAYSVSRPKTSGTPRLASARPVFQFEPTSLLTAAVALGIALKIAALLSIGLGPELFQRLSGSARQLAQLRGQEGAATSNLILLSTVAEAGAAMLTVYRMQQRRNWAGLALITIALLAFTYLLTAKRISIALVAIFLGVAIHKYKRPFTLKDFPLAVTILFGAGMVSLLVRILVPNYAAGVAVDLRVIDYARGSLLDFYVYSPEFASFDMVVRASGQGQSIIDTLGGRATAFYKANLEPFLYLIPRAIWPGKPDYFIDLSHGFYVASFGGGISQKTPGMAATLVGYNVILAGPFGVAVGLAGFGFLAGWIDRMTAGRGLGALISQAVSLIIVFQFFRQGSIGWVFMSFVQNMAPPLIVWVSAWTLARSEARTIDRTHYG